MRVGHKYAYKADLRRSLARCMSETKNVFGKRIDALSTTEAARWHKWRLSVVTQIAQTQDYSDPLEFKLTKGIRDLRGMDVIIKQSDKNLGLVPVRGDIYNAMLRKWLAPPSFKMVAEFPHDKILRRLMQTILPSQGISPRQKGQMLDHARTFTEPCPFYLIPKIHKKTVGSRPITAQHSYMLAQVSIILSSLMNRFVEGIDEIGKDSKSTVRRLEEIQLPNECCFMTYDVEACYPSIDIQDAIKVLGESMTMFKVENQVWLKLLDLVMTNNYVTANGKIFLQKIGTATGTQVAPPFANMYLYYKFKHVLDDESIIFRERYIDDGILIVKTREDCERIKKGLLAASNLNLTFDISEISAVYLDLTVYKGRRFIAEKKVDLKVYFKPTNKMLYLPARSHHPSSMKSGIVRGEAIRALRNTSDKGDWLQALQHIFKGLMARGYPPETIKSAWRKIRFKERESFISNEITRKVPDGKIIRTTFHPQTTAIWNRLIAKFPLESVFCQRRFTWNKKQAAILSAWPPRILWMDFNKVSRKLINSRDQWTYMFNRKRTRDDTEDDSVAIKRARHDNDTPART